MDKNMVIEMIETEIMSAIKSLSIATRLFSELKNNQESNGKCNHPKEARLNIATMNNPNAFYCNQCEEEING